MSALSRILTDVLTSVARSLSSGRDGGKRTLRDDRPTGRPQRAEHPQGSADYPGDFQGVPSMTYSPHDDDQPDPGEVVWTWVPFEEDHSQGKDRPALVIGRDGAWLLGLPLTSKDHDQDAGQERHAGRLWCDIGTGEWDRSGRPSEVRVNRVIRIDPAKVRRGGGRLPQDRFDRVADAVRSAH